MGFLNLLPNRAKNDLPYHTLQHLYSYQCQYIHSVYFGMTLESLLGDREIPVKKLLVLLVLTASLLPSCQSVKCRGADEGFVTGPGGLRKVYVPEYFVYRNGRYDFVEGHYRWVISRKTYLKRANRGYTNRPERASIR